MNRFDVSLWKVLIILAVWAVAVGTLWTIAQVMVLGNYWVSAPLGLSLFVGVIIPIIIVWAVAKITRYIWTLK